MSPNNPAPSAPLGARELLGAMQAVQFAVGQAERKASTLVWTNSDTQADLDAAVACIIAALKAFSDAMDRCQPKGQGYQGPVTPPKCGPGFHLEFGICVPDN